MDFTSLPHESLWFQLANLLPSPEVPEIARMIGLEIIERNTELWRELEAITNILQDVSTLDFERVCTSKKKIIEISDLLPAYFLFPTEAVLSIANITPIVADIRVMFKSEMGELENRLHVSSVAVYSGFDSSTCAEPSAPLRTRGMSTGTSNERSSIPSKMKPRDFVYSVKGKRLLQRNKVPPSNGIKADLSAAECCDSVSGLTDEPGKGRSRFRSRLDDAIESHHFFPSV